MLESSGTAWILERLPKGMTRCRKSNRMGWGCKPEGQGSLIGELKVKLTAGYHSSVCGNGLGSSLDQRSKISSLCLCLSARFVFKGGRKA